MAIYICKLILSCSQEALPSGLLFTLWMVDQAYLISLIHPGYLLVNKNICSWNRSLVFFFSSGRVHNDVGPSCDIASQRMFRGGRTEYIRSPTNQTLKFILAFDDPSVSVRNVKIVIKKFLFFCLFLSQRCDILILFWNCMFCLMLQREAKLELFREAVDAYSDLTALVSIKPNCLFCLFLWD